MNKPKSEKALENDKINRIMETVAQRAGYYRANPQRFVSEVLFPTGTLVLAQFQAILLQAMFHNNYIMYLAARGWQWPHYTVMYS